MNYELTYLLSHLPSPHSQLSAGMLCELTEAAQQLSSMHDRSVGRNRRVETAVETPSQVTCRSQPPAGGRHERCERVTRDDETASNNTQLDTAALPFLPHSALAFLHPRSLPRTIWTEEPRRATGPLREYSCTIARRYSFIVSLPIGKGILNNAKSASWLGTITSRVSSSGRLAILRSSDTCLCDSFDQGHQGL